MVVDAAGGGLEIAWLDFQDALLGPRAYDLATLLNDSAQDLDRSFVEARLDDYAAAASLDRTKPSVEAPRSSRGTTQTRKKNARPAARKNPLSARNRENAPRKPRTDYSRPRTSPPSTCTATPVT